MVNYLTDLRTPNYDKDRNGNPLEAPPQGILIHTGGGNEDSDLHELLGKSNRRVSSNLYVNRRGDVRELAPDTYRTWHAGASDPVTTRWWGNTPAAFGIRDGNRLIGLEIEHAKGQDWPKVQMAAIKAVCLDKIRVHAFPFTRIGAHRWYRSHTSPRKIDPLDWNDTDLRAWIKDLYAVRSGALMRVTSKTGANIRQGPGVQYPIVGALEFNQTYWSSEMVHGDIPPGQTSNLWSHYAGEAQDIFAELGFIYGTIVTNA